MPGEIMMTVDIALAEVPVNVFPLTDDTDFKTRETGVVYNSAGMDLVWNFVTIGGAYTQTAVTPTTGGNYDWAHLGDGMYSIEIPASGGASINNDTEGFGWFTGFATGILPWRGPIIAFCKANVTDALIAGSDALQVDTIQVSGTTQTAGDLKTLIDAVDNFIDTEIADIQARLPAALTANGNLKVSLLEIISTALTEGAAGRIAAAWQGMFNVTSPVLTAQSVNQTGDSFARLGAPAGASVSADILAIDNFVDDLEARIGTPTSFGSGATIADNLVDINDNTQYIGVGGADLVNIPNSAGVGTLLTRVGVPSDLGSGADVSNNLFDLGKSLRSAYGTADSGSTTTMVDAARTEADNDYWKGSSIIFLSGSIAGQRRIITDFNAATDTFIFAPPTTQAVSTNTYAIIPADSVWDDTLAEHLIAGSTGAALNAAGAAGDPWSTAIPGAYGAGTAGKIVGDNLNATVSSRATQTSVDTIDDFLDTEIAAIKAKTDNLPTDPADASDIAASFTTVNTKLDTIDDFLDTEIAAIKAKTDNLPTDPADESLLEAAITAATVNLDVAVSTRAAAATALSTAQWTSARAGYLDNLNVLKIKKNTAYNNLSWLMRDSTDHVTPKTGLTVACQRSIDGGAFANCNTATATEISAGVYKVNLAASDLNGDAVMFKFTATGSDARYIFVAPEP